MEPKKGIAVCFAMAEEAGAFKKLCGEKMPLFFTGIGRANAEKATREFLAGHTPELLLTCGFAGALVPELKIGDVVFELPDGGNDGYADVRAKLTKGGAKPAKIACVNQIAATAKDKQKLREETGADAAEMESAAVQAICRERGIRCVTVRVISDTANEDLPLDFNQFLNEDKSVDLGKLMLAVAKAPWKMGALLQLQQNTKMAAHQLAEVLAGVVG